MDGPDQPKWAQEIEMLLVQLLQLANQLVGSDQASGSALGGEPAWDGSFSRRIFLQLNFLLKKQQGRSAARQLADTSSISKRVACKKYEYLLKRLRDVCVAKLLLKAKGEKKARAAVNRSGQLETLTLDSIAKSASPLKSRKTPFRPIRKEVDSPYYEGTNGLGRESRRHHVS